MNRELEPCSMTKFVFTGKENCAQSSWVEFPEPMVSLIFDYKFALQTLQLKILEREPNNREEIGRCFKELETF